MAAMGGTAETQPKYRRLVRLLAEGIAVGELRPGDKLATERELGETHGVSRVTVRAALAELEEQGLIERRQGSGTFVAGAARPPAIGRSTCLVARGHETPWLREILAGCAPVLGGRDDRFRVLHLGEDEPLAGSAAELGRLFPEPTGLLFAGYLPQDEELRRLRAAGHRAICFGRPGGSEPCSFFDGDNLAGANAATAHLLDRGWRRVAYLDHHDETWYHRDRRAGWRRAHAERGREVAETLLIDASPAYDASYQAMRDALRSDPAIDGLLVQCGSHAAAALQALADAGRRPGHDIGVITYDDEPEFAARYNPPLSAVRQRVAETAAEAAALLLQDLAAEAPPIRERIVQPSLVVRGSCGGGSTTAK